MVNRYDRHFRRLARSLEPSRLMDRTVDEAPLTDQELLNKDGGRRFLDFYGDRGLRMALDRYGILGALARRGYPDVTIHTRALDDQHTLFIEAPVDGRTERLVELCLRRMLWSPAPTSLLGALPLAETYEVLSVDWLVLRHPKGPFTEQRPKLPGQDAPGLGIGARVHAVLMRTVARLQLDALVTVAEHYHNAELYIREMPYFDPKEAGLVRALYRDLREKRALSLAEASWAIEEGRVKDDRGETLRWRGELQLSTEDKGLISYFESEAYEEAARAAAEEKSFGVA